MCFDSEPSPFRVEGSGFRVRGTMRVGKSFQVGLRAGGLIRAQSRRAVISTMRGAARPELAHCVGHRGA